MSSPARRLPRIGAHLSVSGGVDKVLERARRIGAEAIQIFPSNPRQWRLSQHEPEQLAEWAEALRRADLPLFVHAIYLINLASPDRELRERSSNALAHALRFGSLAQCRGVVTHIGFHRGAGTEVAFPRVVESVSEAFSQLLSAGLTPDPRLLLLESSAGAKGSLGATPGELGRILEKLPSRVGVCLDTAHLHSAGFAVHTTDGLETFLEDLAREVGLARVRLIHLNDSKSALGSRRDRHENLGEGQLGRRGLSLWVRRPEFREVCFVLETPGFGQEGPDRRNLMRAKRMRAAEES